MQKLHKFPQLFSNRLLQNQPRFNKFQSKPEKIIKATDKDFSKTVIVKDVL